MAAKSVYETQLIKNRKKGIPRLLQIAGTKSILLTGACLLSLIAVIAQITPFITVYLAVNELLSNVGNIENINRAYMWNLSFITLAGIGVYGVLTYIGGMMSHIAAFNILYEIRTALAAKLARIPMGFFTSRTTGSIKKVMNEDVERIELFVAHHILDLVQAIALPVISIIVLFYYDWRLALGVLVPLPLAFAVQFSMYGKSGVELYGRWQKKLSAMNGTIVEYVRGMPVVKIFNQTVSAFKRFQDDVYDYRDLTLHWIEITRTSYSGYLALLSSSALFVLPIGVYLLVSAEEAAYVRTASTVFLFLYVGMGIAVPLYKMMNLMSYMIQNNTGLKEIDSILDYPEIPQPANPIIPDSYSIEFSHVNFAYDDVKVLKDVSFSVPENTVTALVGPSGGGKSTIANLTGRFWDVNSGEILIGGVNIKDMPVEFLNNIVSTVFQDVYLFFDTIEENIRMGNQRVSFEEVIAAAQAARIHDFIMTLPQGYNTKIGEGGTYLSGGEAQRISLARALLKDAPIVVLDEATAYADPENESRIQEALTQVLKNKTVIIIAHRLYTITGVDQILVVNNGTIAEAGRHDELANGGGIYDRLWKIHTAAREWNLTTDSGGVL